MNPSRPFQSMRGASLVELMVTLALGLLVMTGLLSLFVRAAANEQEANRAAEQIENGRYALEVLTAELQLAGFYGEYQGGTPAATLGDPCLLPVEADLGHAVQGYPAVSVSTGPTVPASCTALSAAVLQLGSDVLVVRRADANAVALGATTVTDDVYVQANVAEIDVQLGAGAVLGQTKTAANTTATLLKKDPTFAAEIRKLHVRVYFVDRSGTVPVLRRLELGPDVSGNRMATAAVAEGVERLTVEYGIDDAPATRDGVPDLYVRDPSATQMADVVAVKLTLLARNSGATPGFVDAKSYDLGFPAAYVPADSFKRHLFSTVVRLKNPAGRRES